MPLPLGLVENFELPPPLASWFDITSFSIGLIGTLASIVGLVVSYLAWRRARDASMAAREVSRQYGRELARSSATEASHLLERAEHSLRADKDELAEHQVNEAQRAFLVVAVYAGGLDKDSVPLLRDAARELIETGKQIGGAVSGTAKLSNASKRRIMNTLRDKRELAERFKVELVARENHGPSNE